jgi:hypothetical protein
MIEIIKNYKKWDDYFDNFYIILRKKIFFHKNSIKLFDIYYYLSKYPILR